MFDRVRKSKPSDAEDRESQIRVLAVTHDASGWPALVEAAGRCGWALFWADSCSSALATLTQQVIPVVICDRDLPGDDWRSVVTRITALRQPVSILLASSVADDYLWRELVQHHGFDVVPKPFQPERLIRAVNSAWSWEGWMHRQSGSAAGS